MYTVEILFPATELTEAIGNAIDQLFSCWRNNGQLAGREFPSWTDNDGTHYIAMMHGEDALAPEHNSSYANEALTRLAALNASPTVTVKGPCPESDGPCRCTGRKSLILYTSFISMESPVRCGDCFRPVPLYKLGENKNEDFFDIRGWDSDYKSCDLLQMGCTVGERFGERQLYAHDSALNREAGTIATRLEKLTGLPTFVFLMKCRGKSHDAEKWRDCPRCGGHWLLPEPRHELFDFCCEKCRLLSNISWDVRKHSSP